MSNKTYLEKFEKFLGTIDFKKYEKLRKIKTVEQDLPRDLNPLPLIYEFYWDRKEFIEYEKFFEKYWNTKAKSILEFAERYFYGCTIQFVKEGLIARLFRTWISILTQFHLQYLWIANYNEPLQASAELDMLGIDALIEFSSWKVGIQIKKISFRREAAERKFTKRQQKYVDIMVEVPYIVIDEKKLQEKLKSSRTKEETKEKIKKIMEAYKENFEKLPNGFVIFRKNYLDKIYKRIKNEIEKMNKEEKRFRYINYTEFIKI